MDLYPDEQSLKILWDQLEEFRPLFEEEFELARNIFFEAYKPHVQIFSASKGAWFLAWFRTPEQLFSNKKRTLAWCPLKEEELSDARRDYGSPLKFHIELDTIIPVEEINGKLEVIE